MSLREKQSRFVENVGFLILKAYQLGYELTFGDTYPGKWKHNPNGFHPKGLAIDLNLFKDGVYLTETVDYQKLGEFWELLDPDCTWGGRFKKADGCHFSYGEK